MYRQEVIPTKKGQFVIDRFEFAESKSSSVNDTGSVNVPDNVADDDLPFN